MASYRGTISRYIGHGTPVISGHTSSRNELSRASRSIAGMVTYTAAAGILATGVGVLGSLVQARFIYPDQLGDIRKYSMISTSAVFASLGLFTILQREYPVLIGRGRKSEAAEVASVVQSWTLLISWTICGALAMAGLWATLNTRLLEAAGILTQVVAVWSTLYVGYLTCTFRTNQDFNRLATSQIVAAIVSIIVLPLFWYIPIHALVLRTIVGPIASALFLYFVRPLKLAWNLPFRSFLSLVKRGSRLFVGTYLRYGLWFTVEIWLMYRVAGNTGVGLFVFSRIFVEAAVQLPTAINQVFAPKLAQRYGESASPYGVLRFSLLPTLLNILFAIVIIVIGWLLVPPVILKLFPNYRQAIPLINILLLQTLFVSVSLPIYLVVILEGYWTQFFAAIIGLAIFCIVVSILRAGNSPALSVAWGTVTGQLAFTAICLLWSIRQMIHDRAQSY